MEYPQDNHLYKYCAYNTNSLSILINKIIWVAKPESFNDPFDCNIRFKSEINTKAFRKYLDRTGRNTGKEQKKEQKENKREQKEQKKEQKEQKRNKREEQKGEQKGGTKGVTP